MSADRAPVASRRPHQAPATWALALSSLGIVFGDLGTSPLYTLQECFTGTHGVPATRENVLGIISLVIWSLIVVVTIKYLVFLMRADSHGEGGIMVLLSLLPKRFVSAAPGKITALALVTLIGASLLLGDGVITPAISVLSAVEGLGVATKALEPVVIPVTIVILIGLFAAQRRGTGQLARWFGPVMLTWFVSIAVLGGYHLLHRPDVLWALSPTWGARFFRAHGFHGVPVLGGVVLAVTGGEALYADMGHFGRQPIQRAWLVVCLPALILAYLGQGAVLLESSAAASRPFYSMCPHPLVLYPMVGLAAVSTVIASQALISGVFSLASQAIQLGYLPRMTVVHTSSHAEGQIYLPLPNAVLGVACIAIVLGFKSSAALASAFGLAVSGTMAITTVVFFFVSRTTLRWSLPKALALLAFFLSFDLPFVFANALKFLDGGWLPFVLATATTLLMTNWQSGRELLAENFRSRTRSLEDVLAACDQRAIGRLPGVAVFMASLSSGAPPTLARLEERFRISYENNVLLTVVTEHVPFVDDASRMEVVTLGHRFYRVILRYGFMESPEVPRALSRALASLGLSEGTPVYIVGRETIIPSNRGKMRGLWEALFALLSRNARSATDFFGLPPEQVVELGSQVDL